MRIGIDASSANKARRTGIEWYSLLLLNAMKTHALQTDERVFLYSPDPLCAELASLPEVWESKVLKWPLSRGWMNMRMGLEMLFRSPDLLFVPGQALPNCLPRGGKTIVTVHDCAFDRRPDLYHPEVLERLRTVYLDFVKRADLFICVSEASRTDLMNYYSVSADRIVVTPLSLNKNVFQVMTHDRIQPALAEYGLERPFILFIGRLEKKKNVRTLIEAYSDLQDDVDLVLIGHPGYGYEEIQEAISLSPKRDRIHQLGYLSLYETVALMNAAELFAFPSWEEGFGIPNLEAMQCGTPLITSDIPVHREIVGSAGLLVDPADTAAWTSAMHRVLTDHSLKRRLVEAGENRVQDFSWKKTAAQTWEAIRSLV